MLIHIFLLYLRSKIIPKAFLCHFSWNFLRRVSKFVPIEKTYHLRTFLMEIIFRRIGFEYFVNARSKVHLCLFYSQIFILYSQSKVLEQKWSLQSSIIPSNLLALEPFLILSDDPFEDLESRLDSDFRITCQIDSHSYQKIKPGEFPRLLNLWYH